MYSDQAKGTKFFYDNTFVQSTGITATPTTNIKFNVSTIIPDNAIGFFYEFSTGSRGLYYPSRNLIVYPDKWHIYYKDLAAKFGKENLVVEDNRILIYNVQGNKLMNFDPEGGGDGVPTDCIVVPYDMYNVTTIYLDGHINMSGKYSYSGLCSGFSITWQTNYSGSWATIPNFGDIHCNGVACTQSPATMNVWYNKTIVCDIINDYYTRIYVRYTDDNTGTIGARYTNPTTIYCLGAETNVTLYYPSNGTEYCLNKEISFQVNATTGSSQLIRNISLYNDLGGVWQANGTFWQHFLNSSKTLTLIYFNNSNLTENKKYPDFTNTNASLNMEAGFLGDYGLNFSNNTGRISYDDDSTALNITYGTICAWVMFSEDYGANSKYLFIDYPNTNENIYFAYDGSQLDWGFKKEHLNNNYILYTTMNNKPKKNEWLFLCIAWDNSYSGIYVNGSLRASSTGRAAPSQRWGHFELGGTPTISESCSCVIDEFVIFDRRLSDTQIGNLYLQSNRTMNFSNIGSVNAGTYKWNAQVYYYPSNAYNYSNRNFTLILRSCVPQALPIFLLFGDDKIDSNILPLLIGILSVIIVWLIIVFLLLWYRRKGRVKVVRKV